ncbi:hypothetical protein BKA62DRAFT_497477 [Auriculariales sp. MPI-PUGE-AT-0066]|nr:hypothetical protein BKA62DRAFT_497477 [Auriculariales sp. MPI-PUGE-AT-0066]
MFALCDESDVELVIPEPSQVLSVLLRLLHEPLARQPAQTGGAIPLPLLPALFRLVDKYALKAELADTLATHLAAHAPVQPLSVYSLATQLELEKVASDATAHLLKKPLHKYTSDEVALIPSVKAYHALVALHAHRVEKLKELVLAEELFPKDYGLCGTHGDATRDVWARKANYVWGQIEPGTDVAEEMSPVLTADVIRDCKLCHMGCIRSIEMIRVR